MSEFIEKQYKIQTPKVNDGEFSGALKSENVKIAFRANEDYLSWDEFRNKSWATNQPETIWQLITVLRKSQALTPVCDSHGKHFRLDRGRHQEFLHEVDLELGGSLLGFDGLGNDIQKQIISHNLIEESFASSKLEGANTTRAAARKMIRENRNPRDKSERMILNNHQAMTYIEEQLKHEELTLDKLLDLHRQVTADTLQDSDHEGKLRDTLNKDGKRLVIKPWDNDDTVAYVAPDREFVEEQLPKLIAFANDRDGSGFIHPLVRAIVLHFWMGLLHPFEDGNGRLARILFYWYMLRRGYWAFSYLSLSERILKSPAEYAMAYINSEQDDQDLNYFVQYNISKLKLAREHLQKFLKKRLLEEKQLSVEIQVKHQLNIRQLRLLNYLAKNVESHTTPSSYQGYNPQIGYVTASSDLSSLLDRGFLRKTKNGRNVMYFPTETTKKLFG
jgi:Fic family protein